jgi:hypothetical protein
MQSMAAAGGPFLDSKISFISGLPRSGSTLLSAILRENPRFWGFTPDEKLQRRSLLHLQDQRRLQLDAEIFAAIGGNLNGREFHAGAGAVTAHDASDGIIYGTATGTATTTPMAKNGDDAILFATLASHLSLIHSDFSIIGLDRVTYLTLRLRRRRHRYRRCRPRL